MNYLTTHAKKRTQQRGIPKLMIELLQRFGKRAYDHHGGVIRYLDKAARRAVEKYIGTHAFRRMHEYFDAYIVESTDSGGIITCGHRYAGRNTH